MFGRLRRQVLLVDLLTALQQGQESFADLALATRTVVEAFEDLRHPLAKVLPIGRLDRLSLVATKADHITSGQLNNLVGLLRDMLGEPFMRANARQSGLLAIASVRATAQVTRLWQGEAMQFLRGVPRGRLRRRRGAAGRDPRPDPRSRELAGLRVQHPGFRAAAARRAFRKALAAHKSGQGPAIADRVNDAGATTEAT